MKLWIGLDPSNYWNPDGLSTGDYIDASDAFFVDIIHTDSPPSWRLVNTANRGAGIRQPIGDADFYPNNGTSYYCCQ